MTNVELIPEMFISICYTLYKFIREVAEMGVKYVGDHGQS
jgi:hypothetical protein